MNKYLLNLFIYTENDTESDKRIKDNTNNRFQKIKFLQTNQKSIFFKNCVQNDQRFMLIYMALFIFVYFVYFLIYFAALPHAHTRLVLLDGLDSNDALGLLRRERHGGVGAADARYCCSGTPFCSLRPRTELLGRIGSQGLGCECAADRRKAQHYLSDGVNGLVIYLYIHKYIYIYICVYILDILYLYLL